MTFLHSGSHSKINLSAQDMLAISQDISRNFTPCFSSRVPEVVENIRLSARELLDIGEAIGRDFAPKPAHNMPELILLPVDPGHLHAYWNLGEAAKPDNEQLTLRIYAQPDQQSTDAEPASWFDVAIDNPATHQHISLPEPTYDTAYSAAIGQGADDGFNALVHSGIIHAPHSRAAWQQAPEHTGKNASGLGISKA